MARPIHVSYLETLCITSMFHFFDSNLIGRLPAEAQIHVEGDGNGEWSSLQTVRLQHGHPHTCSTGKHFQARLSLPVQLVVAL